MLALKEFPLFHDCVATVEDIKKWDHLRNLDYDNTFNDIVSLVIGLDHPHLLRPLEVRSGADREPYAVRTALGWNINGPVSNVTEHKKHVSYFISAISSKRDPLLEQVERFWKLEDCQDLHSSDKAFSVEDKRVLQTWNENIKRIGKHYELPIPMKEGFNLKNNLMQVKERQLSLKRKLLRDSELCQRYNQEIQSLVDDGYAEIVPAEEINIGYESHYYLVIFDVKNPHKPEKFRLVFDAKWKCNGTSLNDQVRSGPDLSNSMCGIFMIYLSLLIIEKKICI